jgi:hypothetical protein
MARKQAVRESIARASVGAKVLIVMGSVLAGLAKVLGGFTRASEYLRHLAEANDLGIAVYITTGDDVGRTEFITPAAWSPEEGPGAIARHRRATGWLST